MGSQNENIDQFFRNALNNLEVNAPDEVWERVQNHLYQKKKQKRIQLFISIAATFAVILAAYIGYLIGKQTAPSTIQNNKSFISNNIHTNQMHKIIADTVIKFKNDSSFQKNPTIPESYTSSNSTNRTKLATTNLNNQEASQNEYKNKDDSFVKNISDMPEPYDFRVESAKVKQHTIYSERFAENEDTQTMDNNNLIFADSPNLAVQPYSIIVDTSFEESPYVENKGYIENWFITAAIAPMYAYRSIQSEFSSTINQYEKPYFSYAGGLSIYIQKKHFSFGAGLYYTQMGVVIQNLYSLSATSINQPVGNYIYSRNDENLLLNSLGTISNTSSQLYYSDVLKTTNLWNTGSEKAYTNQQNKIELTQQLGFLEVPLNLNYYFLQKKVNIAINIGLSMNYLINNQILQANNKVGYTKNLRQINWSGSIGLQLELPLVNKFYMYMEPRYRYFINSINRDNNLVESHPYSFGLYTGILYRF